MKEMEDDMTSRRRTGIEKAEEDILQGRVYKAASVDDMFKQILGRKIT